MNPIIKKFLVNIIAIIVIFLVIVLISNKKNKYFVTATFEDYLIGTTDRFEQNLPFNKDLAPIITIGDSFIYGIAIEQEETLAYLIQKNTLRKTYNLGTPGQGIQHVLYKLQYSPFFKQENLNPEYVISVFITDHLHRMYINYQDWDNLKYLRYKKYKNTLVLKDDGLKIRPLDFIKISKLGRLWRNYIYNTTNNDEKFNLYKLYLKECKKELNKKYPNTKFVIIVYNLNTDSRNVELIPFHTDRWKELEDEGFIIINFDNDEYDFLNSDEYIAEDNLHPNAKAWEKLFPVIEKRLF